MAYKVIWGNFLMAGILNFHTLLFLGYNSETESTDIMNSTNETVTQFKCNTVAGDWYDKFLYPYFDVIDLLFYAIIPFFIMAVCTVLIVKVLYDSKKRLSQMSSRKSEESKTLFDSRASTANRYVILISLYLF